MTDADSAFAHLEGSGAVPDGPVQEVGDGIRTATFTPPSLGGVLGIIEKPHFDTTEPQLDAEPDRC